MPYPPAGGWSAASIPDLAGRTAVVTGANTGLGLETARALAGRGAAVVLAVRDVEKGRRAAAGFPSAGAPVDVQPLDLASLASVRAAADAIRARHPRLDLLVNNAGVMATARARTDDGFELQFGVNHLGHFALTGLLLDRMLATPGSRVVTVSSLGHWFARRVALDPAAAGAAGTGLDRYGAYARSKLANLLFSYELARRLADAGAPTDALAAHPGWTSTEIVRNSHSVLRVAERVGRPLGQPPARGALPILRAATDPDAVGGGFYGPGGPLELRGPPRVVSSSARSRDPALAARLWRASEAMTGVAFPV